jgi:hypothetical protein
MDFGGWRGKEINCQNEWDHLYVEWVQDPTRLF